MNQQRAELLATVTELSARYPTWRLRQLIANIAGWADEGIWDVEDEKLLEAARAHLQQLVPPGPAPKEALGQAARQ